MAIDCETGLPKLPEDHFWRVYSDSEESSYLRVSIFRRVLVVKKRGVFRPRIEKFLVPEEVAMGVVPKDSASAAEILNTAEWVLRKFQSAPKDWRQFVGDYPPKKFGDK